MGRTNKYWKGWGTEFIHAIFGSPKKQQYKREYKVERMFRLAKRKQRRAYDKAKRFAKRHGY